MKSLARLTAVALVLLLACTTNHALAARPNRTKSPTARLEKKLAESDLSTEAREKAKKTIEQHAARLKEAQARLDEVLTKDLKKSLGQAKKEARTAGKKGRQAHEAAVAALKLDGEQKSKLKSAEDELQAARTALNKDLQSALSKDDLAKIGLKAKKKKT